jgi:hypothetical protein
VTDPLPLVSHWSRSRVVSGIEPVGCVGRPTIRIVSSIGGTFHEPPHRSDAIDLDVQQRDYIGASFPDLLFDVNNRFNPWLGISVRLDHLYICKVDDGLDQILGYPAANHQPDSASHFDRERHRGSPHF